MGWNMNQQQHFIGVRKKLNNSKNLFQMKIPTKFITNQGIDTATKESSWQKLRYRMRIMHSAKLQHGSTLDNESRGQNLHGCTILRVPLWLELSQILSSIQKTKAVSKLSVAIIQYYRLNSFQKTFLNVHLNFIINIIYRQLCYLTCENIGSLTLEKCSVSFSILKPIWCMPSPIRPHTRNQFLKWFPDWPHHIELPRPKLRALWKIFSNDSTCPKPLKWNYFLFCLWQIEYWYLCLSFWPYTTSSTLGIVVLPRYWIYN